MATAPGCCRDEARALERRLDPTVAAGDAVVPPALLGERGHVPAAVALAVEPQDLLGHRHRDPLGAGPLSAMVVEPVVAVVLVAPLPTIDRPLRDPKNLRRFVPLVLPAQGPQDDLLDLHRSLLLRFVRHAAPPCAAARSQTGGELSIHVL